MLAWVAVAALLLIVARIMLPWMGLGGVEGEYLRWLARLLPAALILFVASITGIVVLLRRQSKFVEFRPKRLVDEAEEWGDEYRFGDYSPEKALGWQVLSEEPQPAEPVERPAGAIQRETRPAPAKAGRAATPADPLPFTAEAMPELERPVEPGFQAPPADLPYEAEALPELERQIELVFQAPYDIGVSNEAAALLDDAPRWPLGDVVDEAPRWEVAGEQLPYLTNNAAGEASRQEPTAELVAPAGSLPAPEAREVLEVSEEAEPEVRRVTADLLVSDEFAPGAEDDAGEPRPGLKRISDEAIAHYQHLIESATLPALTLHQLPPAPPEFSGRAVELDDLLAAHASREMRVLGLQGSGGVGKTTLALKLADRLKAEYADAQFYIDLKGASARPMPVAEAQAHVIRAYLPTLRLPESEAELDQLYRSLLMDKRAIVLLDNAANAQQLQPLIAPNGCLTIVTSRQHVSLPNSFLRHLEGLPEPESRDLLLKLMPQLGHQAERIAELCGHLPLALRLAVGALAGNASLTTEAYLENLEYLQTITRSSGLPVRPIESVLKLSYEQLPPGLQKLWRMLAVFTDSFDLHAAAAVWKLPLVRASVAHDRLLAASMIERNRTTGRIRLHDLMAAFADARLGDDERAVARQRHAAHYQSVLHEADALYEQGGDLMKLGVDLVDLEWQNVQAGQVWAASAMDEDRAARELCNSFPDAGKYVLDLRQHPRERIRWTEAALEAARKMNRDKAAARHLIGLGDCYTALSELHHAVEFYEQSLAATRQSHDRRGEADALSGLGTAQYLGGELAKARDLHNEAMALFASLNDRRGEATAIGNLGFVHYAMGDLKLAAGLFDRQLLLAREIGDRRNESYALGGLGVTAYSMGDARRSAELLNQQLAITREIGDRRAEAGALTNLGNACASLQYAGQAIAYHEQALSVAREIGDRRSEASALGGLGVSEFLAGHTDRSIELLDAQWNLAHEIGDRRGEALCLGNLGEALLSMGQTSRAIESLRQAFQINSQIGDVTGQANSAFDLALALDQTGERAQAIECAETALRLYEVADHPHATNLELVQRKLREWRVPVISAPAV
jgi:tetratricopeptide (TPR) repeat protein